MESNRIEQMDIKKYIGENKYNEENYQKEKSWDMKFGQLDTLDSNIWRTKRVRFRVAGSVIWVIGFVGICCAAFAKLGNAYFHFKVKVSADNWQKSTSSMIYRINFPTLEFDYRENKRIPISDHTRSVQTFFQFFSFSRIFRNGVPRKTDLHAHVCKLVEFKNAINVSLKNFSF